MPKKVVDLYVVGTKLKFLIEQKILVRFFYAANIIYKSKDGYIAKERCALFIIIGIIND